MPVVLNHPLDDLFGAFAHDKVFAADERNDRVWVFFNRADELGVEHKLPPVESCDADHRSSLIKLRNRVIVPGRGAAA